MKKKVLFAAYSLDVGGIETALVTLLNYLNDKYDITLVLEKKQGIFLDKIPENVKVIEYKINLILQFVTHHIVFHVLLWLEMQVKMLSCGYIIII